MDAHTSRKVGRVASELWRGKNHTTRIKNIQKVIALLEAGKTFDELPKWIREEVLKQELKFHPTTFG